MDPLLNQLQLGRKRVGPDSRHNQQKFITAITNQHIGLPDKIPDDIRHRLQHHIARMMAIGIVVELEVVQIDYRHTGPLLHTPDLILVKASVISAGLFCGGMVPLREFVNRKQDRDILVRVIVKKRAGCFAYLSVRNQSTDFPVLACAASCIEGEYRLSVGARPARAMLLLDDQHLLDEELSEDSVEAFAGWAKIRIPTGSNLRGSAAYRSRLVGVLSRRSLNQLKEMQG